MKSTLLISTLTVAICVTTLNAQNGGIIARISGEDVTAATLAPFFQDISERERKALEENPSLLNQAVRSIILRRLLMKEALASGWDKRPDVAERVEKVQEAVVLESYLEEVTRPPAGFPSDKEVAEIYDARKAEMRIPKQFELAQIFIPQGANADKVQAAAAKALLDQIQGKLKAPGADFLEVAKSFGDQGAVRGGAVGWLAADALQPEIRKVVEPLAKGAVTAPVQLDDGFYIVKVLDVRDPRTPTLEEVKPQLVDAIREQRSRLNRDAYFAKLAQQHPMSINELSLPGLLKKN